METFKIENIKIPPIKVVPELNKETGILKLHTHVMGIITEEIAELNSKAIRESLVEMGWTSPEAGTVLIFLTVTTTSTMTIKSNAPWRMNNTSPSSIPRAHA